MKNFNFLSSQPLATRLKPKPGRLLIAQPSLRETWFCHAVGMMVDQGEEQGSVALMLNQETNITLNQCVEQCHKPVPIYAGGPVATNQLSFLHTLGDLIPGTVELTPGLWLGGDLNEAVSFINTSELVPGMFRFFLGYSGWSPGQLEDEIKHHTWVVGRPPADPEWLLEENGDTEWHHAVRDLGPRFAGWKYHAANIHAN